MASVIETYLDELVRHLSHDPALARRVRIEFADHFSAMAGDLPSEEDAHEAVRRMGPAHAVAATFAADGMVRQADRAWLALLAALVATFAAMRLRTLWLPPLAADGPVAGLIAPLIDRWGFSAAIVAAAGGFWLTRRAADGTRAGLIAGRATVLALAALAASLAAGILRIVLAADWTAAPLAVTAATLGECLIVVWLMAQVLALQRHGRRARALSPS